MSTEHNRQPMATVHRLFDTHENGHDIKKWNAVRRWGARNAYTLIFLSIMFFITWGLLLLVGAGVIK